MQVPASPTVVPHELGTPPPPQMMPASTLQVPQFGVSAPQPSPTWPHDALACAQFRGWQVFAAPQTFGVPEPPHVWPDTVHAPHEIVLPQPSAYAPQFNPTGHDVRATQPPSTNETPGLPQVLAMPPPPQVSPVAVQLPQLSKPPQPSETGPHVAFKLMHVRGMQPCEPPHCDGVPAPPHV